MTLPSCTNPERRKHNKIGVEVRTLFERDWYLPSSMIGLRGVLRRALSASRFSRNASSLVIAEHEGGKAVEFVMVETRGIGETIGNGKVAILG